MDVLCGTGTVSESVSLVSSGPLFSPPFDSILLEPSSGKFSKQLHVSLLSMVSHHSEILSIWLWCLRNGVLVLNNLPSGSPWIQSMCIHPHCLFATSSLCSRMISQRSLSIQELATYFTLVFHHINPDIASLVVYEWDIIHSLAKGRRAYFSADITVYEL